MQDILKGSMYMCIGITKGIATLFINVRQKILSSDDYLKKGSKSILNREGQTRNAI